MKFSLFRSGWGPRVGAAIVYAIVAFGTVAIVTRPASPPGASAGQGHQPGEKTGGLVTVRIVLESVQPVTQWTVRNAGEIIEPQLVEARSWEAVLRCAAIDLSVVTAAGAGHSTNALRVRLETGSRSGDFTFWCPGDCAISIAPVDFPLSTTDEPAP